MAGSGKRRAVPEVGRQAPGSRARVVLPGLAVGTMVAAAWAAQTMLGVPAPVAVGSAVVTSGGTLWLSVRRAHVACLVDPSPSEPRVDAEPDLSQPLLDRLITQLAIGRDQIGHALAQVEQGHIVTKFDPVTVPAGDLMTYAEGSLQRALGEAQQAVYRAAASVHARADDGGQAAMMVAIADRLRAVLDRVVEAISVIEADNEDPILLKHVFKVDHLVMLIRRAVENVAVLGGSMPPANQKPLPVYEALRLAVSEVEDYPRVEVPPLAEQGWHLHGYAGPTVVHLLAELVENATSFSDPQSTVYVRATPGRGGLVIAVEDSGLSMPAHQLAELNALLANPQAVDTSARIRRGQLGLLVAAQLAAVHRIRVQLRPRDSGGHRALVLLPEDLLHVSRAQPEPLPAGAPARSGSTRRGPAPVVTPTGRAAAPAGAARHPAHLPPLPRRQSTPPAATPAAPMHGPPVAVRPNPNLMADFSDGIHSAQSPAGNHGP